MKLKIVDGFKIRNTIDVDFAAGGHHSIYPYIPKGEFWLEKYYLPEKEFMIDFFKKRRARLGKNGYKQIKKFLRLKNPKKETVEGVKIKLLKNRGVLKVYLVNGPFVRQNIDPNFCLGGHWLVYNYIPKNEVWLDDAVAKKELKYILVHELFEVALMKKGKSYNNAHDFANAAEKESRRNDGAAKYIKD